MSENRIFWSLGKGRGDEMLGVEVSASGDGRVRRTIFSRGKFGREMTIAEEEYTAEEFLDIVRAEGSIARSQASGENGGDEKGLLLEAIEIIRRAYNGL